MVFAAPPPLKPGLHLCTWRELESRAGVPEKQLAGRWMKMGIRLKGVESREEAVELWSEWRAETLPEH